MSRSAIAKPQLSPRATSRKSRQTSTHIHRHWQENSFFQTATREEKEKNEKEQVICSNKIQEREQREREKSQEQECGRFTSSAVSLSKYASKLHSCSHLL